MPTSVKKLLFRLFLPLAVCVILFAGCSQAKSRNKNKKSQKETSAQTEASSQSSSQGSQKNQNGKSENKESEKGKSGNDTSEDEPEVTEDGTYTSKEEVALYIHLFGHLPDNFITKQEARDLGWVSSKGNLNKVAPGKSIGGDRFGNYEGLLPEKKGRKYFECDIDADGGYRGAKRIIYSNDGLVYYTEDHYESFELLYE